MADLTDNLPVSIYGGDAILGSDVFKNNGETAHAQIIKTAWGDDDNTYKTNVKTPLPVRIYGSSGDNARVVVTGGVYGLGAFTVSNTFGSPIYIANGVCGPVGITGTIQGISGGYPLNVTGTVSLLGFAGITGLVNVTGGRGLSYTTDSITVYGVVGTTRSWSLSAANDIVTVSPFQGGYTHSTYIAGPSGGAIGAVNDSLKVYVSNVGFTIDATISPIVFVSNATGGSLQISGVTWNSDTNPIPVVVRGTKASEYADSGINSGDMVVSLVDGQSIQISNSPYVDIYDKSNLYSYLHGSSDIGANGSVGANIASVQNFVSNIANRLSSAIQVRTRNDTTSIGGSVVKNWFVSLNAGDKGPVSLSSPENPTLSPIQGTHIKNLTYLRTTSDPPPVTIALGTQSSTAPDGFALSLYLDPGESIFIPMSVSGMYAKIEAKSVNASYSTASYANALGIMSV